MGEPLRVLLVEDSEDDATFVLRELARSGYTAKWQRVQTRQDVEAALTGEWDVILCDFSMPELDAPTVLELVKRRDPDLPFIVVSGTIGEETAVDMMRKGAHDYLLKDRLKRLGPAIQRELRDAQTRRERRAADEARRKAEESFRFIVESTPDLVVVYRHDHIIYANPSALQSLGYKGPAELIGRPVSTFIERSRGLADTGKQRRLLDLPAPSGDEASVIREQRWAKAAGGWLTVEAKRNAVVFDGEVATVIVARDMTERNQVAAAMIEMDRMAAIGLLAAGVGHEINNPLAYVLANLEFVTSEVDSIVGQLPKTAQVSMTARITDLRQALIDTNEGARRVRDIVSDLRTFSRGGDEKMMLVDVRNVLDSAVRMAAVQLRDRALVGKKYDEVPLVLANESRLGQVFLNLIVNAAQALPEGSRSSAHIDFRTRYQDGFVFVDVIDTGTGIPEDVLARIFEPFFTTKPPGQGTGLGLSISQRIVNSMGGEITAESEVGKGTTITVRLPKASGQDSSPSIPVVEIAPVSSRRARILCVDDEPSIGIALRRVLVADHDVELVTSATDARAQCVTNGAHFDVILCDLVMPGMSGIDLYRELSQHRPELAVRMVFLSGGAFTAEARDFLANVPNRRLDKPVGLDELRRTIDEIISR